MNEKKLFKNKIVVVTGGTGSLGQMLVWRLLKRKKDTPKKIIIFSRDEAKQHNMRLSYQHKKLATDDVIYENFKRLIEFRIGDVRSYASVCSVMKGADILIHTAAIKQVPTCEYFPYEAVQTNIHGAENIVRAIHENNLNVETVVGISTDKACKPVNVMGMTKAIQEKIFVNANILNPKTRFICVRYGNVVASTGSVIPLFVEQIKHGGPLTITTKEMTRFLLYLDQAVDIIFAAMSAANPGEIYVPKLPSARITDLARVLIGKRKIKIIFTGVRPGEKVHEVLVSEEEVSRTVERNGYFVIKPLLPEIFQDKNEALALNAEYSSESFQLDALHVQKLLEDITKKLDKRGV